MGVVLGEMRLSTKVALLLLFSVLVTGTSLLVAAAFGVRSEMAAQAQSRQETGMRVAWQVLNEVGKSFSVDGDRLKAGDVVLNGNDQLVDTVKRLVGGTATVFMGDKRVATNVIKPDGNRAVGTTLAAGPAYDTVLKQGKAYRGQADILGEPYFTGYDPIKNDRGEVIGILYVGVKQSEFFSVVNTLLFRLGAVGVAIAVAVAALGVLVLRRMTRPLVTVTGAIERITGGDLSVSVEGADRGDEIGVLAKTVSVLKEKLQREAEAEAQAKFDQERRQRRAETLDGLLRNFHAEVDGALEVVVSAATQLEATAQSMTHTATSTLEQASNVSVATQQTAANVQTVAAAAEELSASIQEIAAQVAHSSHIAGAARGEAESTNGLIHELSNEVARIGDIVGLINDIASQTNLLALNATIEAARAGDAGKGFAVVANEVKQLANQTGKATDEIAKQIAAVQHSTTAAVAAIKGIADTIEQMSEIANAVAVAVEEQGAATNEIARNVAQASTGVGEVASSVGNVTAAAEQTGHSGTEVLQAAQSLSQRAGQLQEQVGAFLSNVRAV